ncbi:MAG TPA: DUF6340 family protein [Lentimicrobium sp.]|nr:DUF6340 family protein [Lentimicrobium sp.]
MKHFIICLLMASTLLLAGCSKYAMVSFNYPLPPEAELPENIKTIAVVNRSLTAKEDKAGKIIESVLSGEIEVSDRKASEQAILGVSERIPENAEFRCVIPLENKLIGSGTRETPPALEWVKVKEICNTSNADALLVLEVFDSNSDLLLPKIFKPDAPVVDERNFNVVMKWRMYDPNEKKIIDQYECRRQLTFQSDGNHMTVPPKAMFGAAYSGGQEYIERFLPGFFIVQRQIFKKGKHEDKDSFETAYRHVETDDWEGAANAWIEIMKHNSFENTGRACLNMAVYCEAVGNLDDAISWARKAYVDYGIKQAREYEASLRRMKNQEERQNMES